jgi:type II secretory pathway pseudopilin PulG
LIVVVVILILASIAIPHLLRAKIAANEVSAASAVRTINTAEVTYSASWGNGYAPDLQSLGGTVPCVASSTSACLIDPLLSQAPNTKSGYVFAAAGNTSSSGGFSAFEVNATPAVVGVTGQRAFCTDQIGVIRFNATGRPIGTGIGSCVAGGAILVGN